MTSFGERTRALMAERGISLRELARRTHYDPGYLSKIANDRKTPSPSVAARLDDTLNAGGELAALAPTATPIPAGLDLAETTELARRLRHSEVDGAVLDALATTTDQLCTQYAYRPPMELRREAQQWLRYVEQLLSKRVGLYEHRELLVTAGWLTLLIGCLEYDSGLSGAAEPTRMSALYLGREAGHAGILAWALEMAAWFAHTRRDLIATVDAARAGQRVAPNSDVAVQLIAHEARALGRMGDRRAVQEALDRGYALLQQQPQPGNPRHHFVVDLGKFDFYAMDCYRVVGNNDRAAVHAREVLTNGRGPDGEDLAPMRMAEARVALGTVAAREGNLDETIHHVGNAFRADRRCLPSLLLVAGELAEEMRERYPGEQPTKELDEQLHEIRRSLPRGIS